MLYKFKQVRFVIIKGISSRGGILLLIITIFGRETFMGIKIVITKIYRNGNKACKHFGSGTI